MIGTASNRLYVWDLPLRLFHWLLLALVAAALASAQVGGNAMEWHGRFGIAILGLLAFRLAWGVVGSRYARFRTFVRGPAAVIAYLRGEEWSGAGHNPLGAWSVVGLLALLLVQGVSGLFANDDIAFQGPYANAVSDHASALLTGLHKTNFWLLAFLIGLHVTAIVFYLRVLKKNVVTPMLIGYQAVDRKGAPPTGGGGPLALLVALALAGATAWAASGACLEPQAPPPAASTPAW